MYEDEPAWIVASSVAQEAYADLFERLDENEEVNQVRLRNVCEDCNFPGGDRNKQAYSPAMGSLAAAARAWETDDFSGVNQSTKTWQSKQCVQTDQEKGRCPKIFAFYRDLLCTSGRCNSMECTRCAGRSRTGKLRIGDVIMVSGITCTSIPHDDGSIEMRMVPSQRCGKYLGVDVSHSLRFELMKPDGGDEQRTGMRFWLTPSGYFMEDLAPAAKLALSSVKVPTGPRVWKPGDRP